MLELLSPVIAGTKHMLPAPTLCPPCRMQRRLSHRNERHMYKRTCDLTGESIVSLYPAEAPYPVYTRSEWWKEGWDPLAYGKDFDFRRPFFEQFAELKCVVPRPAMIGMNNENSDYVAHVSYSKNCYLIFSGANAENCMYATWVIRDKDCVDCFQIIDSELCYECVAVEKCYDCCYVADSSNCRTSMYCSDCRSCASCLGCVGLRAQEYAILNVPVSQEVFVATRQKLLADEDFRKEFAQKFVALQEANPKKNLVGVQNQDSTGNYLTRTKNLHHCFNCSDSMDSRFITNSSEDVLCMDMDDMCNNTACYEGVGVGWNNTAICTIDCLQHQNIYYSELCASGDNLFGCIGLRHKKYCILNKQYTKEAYEELVPSIIARMRASGEWGEFFPVASSSFAYNASKAQDYFPLTREQIRAKGWAYAEQEEQRGGESASIEPTSRYADNTKAMELLSTNLTCEQTGRGYRIMPQELAFYLKTGLPIPRICPEQRHRNRLRGVAPRF